MQNTSARNILFAISFLMLTATVSGIPNKALANKMYEPYNEKYRPQFHFSPKKNWINDPNGLVYFQKEYHMFFQYNPYGISWGNISWGHAVSKDLVHWEQLPVALAPDKLGMIFSGSVVVDENNTSGFFKDSSSGLVAIYTNAGETQQQSIAYSKNRGRTWIKYPGNPVIPNLSKKDFRDPKVFWHSRTGKWVMAVAAGDRVEFYSSPDLKNWIYMSEFGSTERTPGFVWEVPDLFELPIEGDPKQTKWVLKVDMNPGGAKEGYMGRYFIGQFDGQRFVNENPQDTVLRLDYGKDFYAALSWNHVPDRRIWIGWMNNWQYADKIPTFPWRGAMTIPRQIQLRDIPNQGVRLVQTPIHELTKIRGHLYTLENKLIVPSTDILSSIRNDTIEIVADFELAFATEFGFKVRKGNNQETIVGYDAVNRQLFMNRVNSGNTDFSEHFPGDFRAPLLPVNSRINMRIFVDRSSIEVFGNDGVKVITGQIFPPPYSKGLEIYSKNGSVKLVSLKIYELKSIW